MKKPTLPWLAKKTAAGPAPTTEPPAAPAAEKPRPEPAPPVPTTPPPPLPKRPRPDRAPASEEAKPAAALPLVVAVEPDTAPAWSDKLLWTIPAVMTVASAVFTLWSVWDLAAHASDDLTVHAAGLAAGVVVEGGWVWMLIMAHRQAATGHVSQWNTVAGWGLAGVTALILAAHGVQTGNWGIGLLAVLPLIAKAAWHGLTTTRAEEAQRRLVAKAADDKADQEARKAKEEQERLEAERAAEAAQADDSSLTVEQRRQLADLDNEANFTEELSKRQIRLDNAKAKADHEAKLAEIERQAKENMARMTATANLMVRKAELEERIELSSPPRRRMIALGSGSYAPDDARDITDTGMGFAGAMSKARAAASPTLNTRAAEQVPTPADTPTRGGAQVSAEEGARNAELVWDTRDQIIEETGKAPSINALSVATGLDRRTVKRHLDKG